jgi:hypothetical protein
MLFNPSEIDQILKLRLGELRTQIEEVSAGGGSRWARDTKAGLGFIRLCLRSLIGLLSTHDVRKVSGLSPDGVVCLTGSACIPCRPSS